VKFSGQLECIRAMALEGVEYPHLFMRLHNASGANGTVDAGERLDLPPIQSGTDLQLTVMGKLGVVDGSLVLFADKIGFGSHWVDVTRRGSEQSK
jgi:hypothetical protein